MTFKDFNFKSRLAHGIARAGFKEPSPIQEQAIPLILEGKDVVVQAHTGIGQTAAFGLPVLQEMTGKDGIEAVVIVPTRELASQVADELYKFSRHLNIRTATVYGGTSYKRQIMHIENAGIIVATPGRFLDLLSKGKIDIHPKYVILDEADEMLNMGFLEDVRRIFTYFEDRKQTLMFSATMPNEIKDLSETLMSDPQFIRVEKEAVTNNNIKQYYYVVDEHERDDAIVRLVDHANPKKAIIFCRTKRETARLAEHMNAQGYKTEALHGDMEQHERQKTMKSFRRNECELLVATDVAARGLDVRGVTHVFNYHIPFEAESYVHRIGRTGRAQRKGDALMLVTPHELRELKRIQKDVGSELTLAEIPKSKKTKKGNSEALVKILAESEKAPEKIYKLLEDHFGTDLPYKLLGALVQSQVSESKIGKSKEEVEKLLGGVGSDVESETKKSSRKYKEQKARQENRRSGNSGGRRRQSSSTQKIERGNERGQVPIPTITNTGGGSRIVARKLF